MVKASQQLPIVAHWGAPKKYGENIFVCKTQTLAPGHLKLSMHTQLDSAIVLFDGEPVGGLIISNKAAMDLWY